MHIQWDEMNSDKLKDLLAEGWVPTSESVQALVKSEHPETSTFLKLMLEAWPEAMPIDVGDSLDYSYRWQNISSDILTLLLEHGMVLRPYHFEGLMASQNPEKSSLLALMIQALPEELSKINGEVWDYPWYWEQLSQDDLIEALSEGLTPTSQQLQALVSSDRPETGTFLTLMLEAWPEGTPIDMGHTFDAYIWHSMPPEILTLFLDRGLVTNLYQTESLMASQNSEKFSMLPLVIQALPEALLKINGAAWDHPSYWTALSKDDLIAALTQGLTPTSKQLQALVSSDHPETGALLNLMLDAWPAGEPIDLGRSLDHSASWNPLSSDHLHALLKHNITLSDQTIQASLGSRFPMTEDHLETMLQHAKQSMALDAEHITDILHTILIHKSHDASMLKSLVTTLMPHTDSINFQEALLKFAIQEWNPRHFMESSTHQWIVELITTSMGQDRFTEACHAKVSDFILQGHFHLAEQFGVFCPEAWSSKSTVAWMADAVATNLAHHLDQAQASQAMQALMARHLAVHAAPEDTAYFYEDLARDYFLRAKKASASQTDSDSINDAVRQWNQDFSAEIIRLNNQWNDHQPDPVTVFRGINLEQSWNPGMADAWFDYGHTGFSKDQMNFKFFQFSFVHEHENMDKAWEIAGTYTSLDPEKASAYAVGFSAHFNFNGARILFEATLPQGSIGVCGEYDDQSELILPELVPDVIYVLDSRARVLELYQHPDRQEIASRFQIDDIIKKTEEDKARYDALQCNLYQQLEDQSEPQTPDMLDEYYGFPVPKPIDYCAVEKNLYSL
jgi:hypothetical protein